MISTDTVAEMRPLPRVCRSPSPPLGSTRARASPRRAFILAETLDEWFKTDRETFVRLLDGFTQDLARHLERPQLTRLAS